MNNYIPYTEENVWSAVGFALPSIKKAHDLGINFNLASIIDDALLEVLFKIRTGVLVEDETSVNHTNILMSAYNDLHNEDRGSFNFKD